MKMFEFIENCSKDTVYDSYFRIVFEPKEQDKISNIEMIKEIYDLYNDETFLPYILTKKEVNYLEKVINKDEDLLSVKYTWEQEQLIRKFLLIDCETIPLEMIDNVKKVIEKFKTDKYEKDLNLISFLIGYIKVNAYVLEDFLINLGSQIFKCKKSVIEDIIYGSPLFNFYVGKFNKNTDKYLLYFEYHKYFVELLDIKKKNMITGSVRFYLKEYQSIFYNDVNLENPTIKKFYNELLKFSDFRLIMKDIRVCVLLNKDRKELKQAIKKYKNPDDKFFKLMDNAMDEMLSGALNGYSKKDYEEKMKMKLKINMEKMKNAVIQTDACIGKNEADLFYKLYYALLEYTNKKYEINKKLKIYKKTGNDPSLLSKIIDEFWIRKDKIIDEFCKENPYKFNEEELKIVSNFKNGIRDKFVIAKYNEEYAYFVCYDKVYMVKGLNTNIDRVVSYVELPSPCVTTLLPFKDYIVYDGILMSYDIDLGVDFNNYINEYCEKLEKYYKL